MTTSDEHDPAVDYRRALTEAADYLRRFAAEGRPEAGLLGQCPDRAGLMTDMPYPMPALDPRAR